MEEKYFPEWSLKESKKKLFNLVCSVNNLEKLMEKEKDPQIDYFIAAREEAKEIIGENNPSKEEVLNCYSSLKDFAERYECFYKKRKEYD